MNMEQSLPAHGTNAIDAIKVSAGDTKSREESRWRIG